MIYASEACDGNSDSDCNSCSAGDHRILDGAVVPTGCICDDGFYDDGHSTEC